MENAKYALIENNVVTNIVLWDGDTSKWQPPHNAIVIKTNLAYIGDWWEESEGIFYRPIVEIESSDEQQADAQ